jgi:hypothetical protein
MRSALSAMQRGWQRGREEATAAGTAPAAPGREQARDDDQPNRGDQEDDTP